MDNKGEQSRENDNRKLYSACRRGDVDFIEQLPSLGLDIDLSDSKGWTPLMIAALAGQPDVFHFLIARGSDHTLKDNFGRSLLHFAAAGGSNDIIEKLLLLGLDIDSKDNNGLTPLMTAASFGWGDSILFLIKNGSDPTGIWSYILYSACGVEDVDFIEQLSSLGLDIDLPDSSGRALLMIAAFTGHPYLVCFLITRGLDHTLKENHHGPSLLHFAAAGGKNDIIEKLLFLGFDIDSRDNEGQTPLMTAALCNQPESFRFLIEKGSDPLLKDNDGRSVLFWARIGLHKDTVKKLLV